MSSLTSTGDQLTPRANQLPGAFPSPPSSPNVSAEKSLRKVVYDRRAEYTKQKSIRVRIGSWNVASLAGTEDDLKSWFVEGEEVSKAFTGLTPNQDKNDGDSTKHGHGSAGNTVRREDAVNAEGSAQIIKEHPSLPIGDEIGLYVLGLQEIVDVSSPAEALRPYNDPAPAKRWKDAAAEALPKHYVLIAEQQLIGLLLLVYAAPAVAPTISSVSVTSVGTGLLGYMGNKGAVVVRILLGETTRMVFVNSHLAAGTEKGSLERRNWDAAQIVSRTKFEPVENSYHAENEESEGIGDEDFIFWFGDLNYRLGSIPGEDVRRLLLLHAHNEYDIRRPSTDTGSSSSSSPPDDSFEVTELHGQGSSKDSIQQGKKNISSGGSSITLVDNDRGFDSNRDPANDPALLQTTLSSLLAHDQLHEQMRTGKAFHNGWQEGPIKFLPTYKYDVGSVGMFDSSEKKRSPSWCDRVLFRTRKRYLDYLDRIKEDQPKKRDEEMKSRGLDHQGEEVIFDYDPETDGIETDTEEQPFIQAGQDSEDNHSRVGNEENLHLDYYISHQGILSSDHKPLDAGFTIIYETADSDLKSAVQQEVARELDKSENESRPDITIDLDNAGQGARFDDGVDFGEVRYDVATSRSMTIANTSRVPATCSFVERHDGSSTPRWLSTSFNQDDHELVPKDPEQGYKIEPGDALQVQLALRVTSIEDVRALNLDERNLDDVLVLRVQSSRDHFIPVYGTWLRTSFGLSLEELIRIPEGGVRIHQISGNNAQEVRWSAPRELFRLTESLEEVLERAVAEWGMKDENTKSLSDLPGWPFARETWTFTSSERDSLKSSVRESLDQGAPIAFPAHADAAQRAEVLAETLLAFLASIDGGIFDEPVWIALLRATLERERAKRHPSNEELRSQILETLSAAAPPARGVAFTLIAFMLARVADEVAPVREPPATPVTPRTPDALLRRARGLSGDPALGRRREVERRFAGLFAEVMFKIAPDGNGRERRANEERRRAVVEVFLRGKWEDGL